MHLTWANSVIAGVCVAWFVACGTDGGDGGGGTSAGTGGESDAGSSSGGSATGGTSGSGGVAGNGGGPTTGGSSEGGASSEGGSAEGGSPDAGATAQGGSADAGATSEGGSPNGGSSDGGSPDGGSPDGGSPDGGSGSVDEDCPPVPTPVAFVCEGGDDAGPGTESEPFESFGRARTAFASLAPGESVAFCRGSTFQRSGGEWVNETCTAQDPCGITAYGPANLPRPVLTGAGEGLNFANGGNAEHQEGYVVTELDLRGDGTTTGIVFFNDIDDVVLCGLDISGFRAAINLQRANPTNPGSDGENDRVSLLNSHVFDNTGQGWLGACNDCRIEGNLFERNGGESDPANRDHSIYLDSHRPISGMVIRDNDVYQTTASVGQCEGAPITAHGNFTDLLIEGNYVHEDPGNATGGCWGIVPDTGYGSEAESFTRTVIRDNVVENVGNVSIGVNACDECLIENNTVLQSNSGTGISSPHRTRGDNDALDGEVTFRDNVVTLTASGQCYNYGPTVVDGGGNECL